MKTITEIQKYGLIKFIANKTEIVVAEKSSATILPKFQNTKKNNMEDVCAKLKNDLKWYKDDLLNSHLRLKERNYQENIIDKELSGKTVSKLVEEWWLGS